MFDPDAETMPREALSALQTTRLKQTLRRAYVDVSHKRSKCEPALHDAVAARSKRRLPTPAQSADQGRSTMTRLAGDICAAGDAPG